MTLAINGDVMRRKKSRKTRAPWLIVGLVVGLVIGTRSLGLVPDSSRSSVRNEISETTAPQPREGQALSAPYETAANITRTLSLGTSDTESSSAQTPAATPAPTATSAPLTNEDLEKIQGNEYATGSKGAAVKDLQSLLVLGGYLPEGEDDGIYGKKTAAAIQQFQEDHSLTTTGIASVATQYRLLESIAEHSSMNGDSVFYGTTNLGLIQWPNQTFYLGSLIDEFHYQEGTFYYSTGEYYVGEFHDNLRNGNGKSFFPNGDNYIGEWKNDRMEGNGAYYFGGTDSTEFYEGEWSNGMMHGKGTYTLADGTHVTAVWAYNQQIGW